MASGPRTPGRGPLDLPGSDLQTSCQFLPGNIIRSRLCLNILVTLIWSIEMSLMFLAGCSPHSCALSPSACFLPCLHAFVTHWEDLRMCAENQACTEGHWNAGCPTEVPGHLLAVRRGRETWELHFFFLSSEVSLHLNHSGELIFKKVPSLHTEWPSYSPCWTHDVCMKLT